MVRRRIDVHHHYVPPAWFAARSTSIVGALNTPPSTMADWTPEAALHELDRHGIAAALLSVSTPGVWFGDALESRVLSRQCNEYGAFLAERHMNRFGVLAALPLPDIEGSLAEIAFALDTLHADGVGLMTSYDGVWLGDAHFAPVFDELNRRSARIFVHPTTPACCARVGDIPPALTEYPFDTTRAITSLLYSGTLARCPRVRWIFAHGGGTLPMLAGRMMSTSYARSDAVGARVGGDQREMLANLYFDTALVSNKPAMAALRSFAQPSHVLFGTDYPFADPAEGVTGLAECGIDADSLRAIECDNALALFPRFRSDM